MQLEEPLAKDTKCGWERATLLSAQRRPRDRGNPKRPGECAARIIDREVPHPDTAVAAVFVGLSFGQAFEGANREFAFYSRLWHLGSARFVGKLLPSATTTAQRGRLLLGGVLR
jgi:hypothetical protein